MESNLFLFTKEILTEELYNLLIDLYGGYKGNYNNVNTLELVPGTEHFISINSCNVWIYKEKVKVTKEQADRFMQINNVIPMNFVEFIESYED